MSSEKRTKAVDLTHHVSDYARRYAASPLKGLQKHHSTKLSCLVVCRAPITSPSHLFQPMSFLPTRSHSPCRVPSLLRHASAGYGAFLVGEPVLGT